MSMKDEYISKYEEQCKSIDKSLSDLRNQNLILQEQFLVKKAILDSLDQYLPGPGVPERFEEFIICPLKLELENLQEQISNHISEEEELKQKRCSFSLAIKMLKGLPLIK